MPDGLPRGRKWQKPGSGSTEQAHDASETGEEHRTARIEFASGDSDNAQESRDTGSSAPDKGSAASEAQQPDTTEAARGRKWTTSGEDGADSGHDAPSGDRAEAKANAAEQPTLTGRQWTTDAGDDASSDGPAQGDGENNSQAGQHTGDHDHSPAESQGASQDDSDDDGATDTTSQQQTRVNTAVLSEQASQKVRGLVGPASGQPSREPSQEPSQPADNESTNEQEADAEQEPKSRAAAVGSAITSGFSGLRTRIGRSGSGPLSQESVDEAAAQQQAATGNEDLQDEAHSGGESSESAPAPKRGLGTRFADWKDGRAAQRAARKAARQQARQSTAAESQGDRSSTGYSAAPGGAMHPHERMRQMAADIGSGDRSPKAAQKEQEEKEKEKEREGLQERGIFIWALDHWAFFAVPALVLCIGVFAVSTWMLGPSGEEVASTEGGAAPSDSDSGSGGSNGSGGGNGNKEGNNSSGEQIPLYDSGLSFEYSASDPVELKAGELLWEGSKEEVQASGSEPVEIVQLAGPTAAEVSPAYEMAAAEGDPASVTTTTFAVESEGAPDVRGTYETFSGQSPEGSVEAPNGTYSVTEDSGALIAEGTYSDNRTGNGDEVIRTYTENIPGQDEPREFRVRYEAPEGAPIPLLVGWQEPTEEDA